jgi:plastocyanin domain-containing protein
MNNFSKLTIAALFLVGAMFLVSCTSAGKSDNATVSNNAHTTVVNKSETVVANPNEPIKITVSTNYEPKSVTVKKGQPVKLAFFRPDDKNCGDEVVFPKEGIRKKLPVGETVIVEMTPTESGEISFTCGMDMMRGKVVVTN